MILHTENHLIKYLTYFIKKIKVKKWMYELKESALNKDIVICIAGNKIDNETER